MSASTNYYFIKENVDSHEFHIQDIIYRAGIVNVPKVYQYDEETKTLTMRRIPCLSVADMYGENFEDIPGEVIEKIRDAVTNLYHYGIEYPDITGYNFIEYQNKIWVVDFEHASLNTDRDLYDPFIRQFINGRNTWNPSYM